MSTTQHPLTETAAVELTMKFAPSVVFQMVASVVPDDLTEYARAAFDVGREHERDNPEGDRPWESLGESDQVCVGDEVKWDYYGLTMTATVARVDKTGSLYTAAGLHIGVRSVGAWYVRRAVQELPTEDGAVIVPAEGREFIETRSGKKSRRLTWDAESYVWYDARGTHLDADIITGTWKVDEK